MKKQITFQQYRAIDLTIMMVVLAVSQFVIYMAASVLYPDQLYVVSPVAVVTALVLMRWNGWAAIHAGLGGILYALIAGGNWHHLLIYGVGNLLSMAALPLLKFPGKERIRKDALLTMLFAFAVQILMQLGRCAVAALLGYPADICIGFILTDLLSVLFSVVIAWIIRRADGLFEDQKQYLLRIQQEHNVERGEQF